MEVMATPPITKGYMMTFSLPLKANEPMAPTAVTTVSNKSKHTGRSHHVIAHIVRDDGRIEDHLQECRLHLAYQVSTHVRALVKSPQAGNNEIKDPQNPSQSGQIIEMA